MKGYKTLLFALVIGVLGVLDSFVWQSLIPEKITPFVIPMIAIIVGYLRKITTTAMGESE